jgi:starvation-inducible DNA-binding protein
VAAEAGDDGTKDLMARDVSRRNDLQVWFVAGHLGDTPFVQAV